MQPENTSLYLSEHSLALYPTLVQPHAEYLPRMGSLHPGLVQPECESVRACVGPAMSSLLGLGHPFPPSETFGILTVSPELGVITKAV